MCSDVDKSTEETVVRQSSFIKKKKVHHSHGSNYLIKTISISLPAIASKADQCTVMKFVEFWFDKISVPGGKRKLKKSYILS